MTASLYAFDAYGTLFDVHAAVARHAAAVGPEAQRLSEIWRAKQLEYTWTRTLAGAYRDFEAVTRDALAYAAARCGGLSPDLCADLMAAYATLDAYPDVRPTLERLKARGARLAILSNGTPGMLQAAVTAAGFDALFDAVLSVDAIGVYKTAPAAYAMATERFGVPPSAVSFQSSNRWDVMGATRFGFRCVWVNRTDQPDEYPDLAPAHVVRTLDGLPALQH
ncbi:MAG TPA: haloacid dehalogenase type II [Beijerinckiaceae bacterium]|jgi:2-haloacid dehalogenase